MSSLSLKLPAHCSWTDMRITSLLTAPKRMTMWGRSISAILFSLHLFIKLFRSCFCHETTLMLQCTMQLKWSGKSCQIQYDIVSVPKARTIKMWLSQFGVEEIKLTAQTWAGLTQYPTCLSLNKEIMWKTSSFMVNGSCSPGHSCAVCIVYRSTRCLSTWGWAVSTGDWRWWTWWDSCHGWTGRRS